MGHPLLVAEGAENGDMSSKEQFSPLCDLHHTPMRRKMVEEESDEVRSFHACGRPGCTRVFRTASGYTDRVDGEFEDERANARPCPCCGGVLYLSEVNHVRKVETWECPQDGCEFSEDSGEPAGR